MHEFSASGTFLGHIPLTVSEDAVEISGSTLYAESATSTGDELTAYDLAGHQLSPTVPLTDVEWSGPPGTCCGQPITPAFVADDAGITVATSDHRIEQLAPDGTVLNAWGGLPTAQISPRAAVGDAAGNIYVVDMTSGHHRVLKYDAQGDPPIAIADLDADFSGGVTSASATTDSHGNILIHSSGTVVTMDTDGHVISVVKLDCQYCDGQIATAPNGTIYAIDWQDVGVFASNGSRLGTWPITTKFLATDAAGNVYAAAAGGTSASTTRVATLSGAGIPLAPLSRHRSGRCPPGPMVGSTQPRRMAFASTTRAGR